MKKVILSVLSLLALLAFVGALNPSFREKAQDYFQGNTREVLATAEGDLLNDGTLVKAVKYRGGGKIFVEVLRAAENSTYSLVDRIDLPDRHDGLFNFHGHVTRLAITDVDGNGTAELLAPSFDEQLVPHLNIFSYNNNLKKFEAMQPPQNN